jgi:hypothetical protein
MLFCIPPSAFGNDVIGGTAAGDIQNAGGGHGPRILLQQQRIARQLLVTLLPGVLHAIAGNAAGDIREVNGDPCCMLS